MIRVYISWTVLVERYEEKNGHVNVDTSGDRLRVGWLWEGHHESKRCSREVTYPESYITK